MKYLFSLLYSVVLERLGFMYTKTGEARNQAALRV